MDKRPGRDDGPPDVMELISMKDRKTLREQLERLKVEEKIAGEALARSRREWTALFQAIGHPAVVLDSDHRIARANPEVCRILGRSEAELIGQRCFTVFHPAGSDQPPTECPLRRMLISKTVETVEMEMEPLGGDFSVSCTPILDDGGSVEAVIHVATDITERLQTDSKLEKEWRESEEEKKKLQKQLIQIQKMEAIGTLAGGIAHDFNNILMGVQGYISLLLYDLKPDHPHRAKLENIENYIRRGADLTKQLLGFARGGKYDVKATNMNELLTNSADLFGRTRRDIDISKSFERNLWTVDVDQGQMDQVFLNLFINASQAMPGGGNLSLKTDNVTIGKTDAKLVGVTEGRYVRISVTDNGVGMDAKTQERIFEPFFTTKPKGTGTGLGLASAYGIIQNHGGSIQVASERGKGTTFTVYLCVTESRPAVREQMQEEFFTGWETIMVVDDEQVNISVITEMLEMLHYRVLPIGSGQEAIAVYMEKGKEIDLVILDMVMPGISGGRTFDILREINPDVAVILASGYSAEGEARAIINRGCRGFIQKPFQLQALSRKIREVLENRGTLNATAGIQRKQADVMWASPNNIPC